jgi:hypothetical protein
MIGHFPKNPSGSNAEARFMQNLHEQQFSNRIQETQGQIVSRTTKGMVVRGAVSSGQSISVGRYRVKEEHGDYLTCHDWDGTTEGTSDVYVAKEWKTRHSLASEVVAGTTYSYTYVLWSPFTLGESVRTATDGSVTESEVIRPPWAPDEEILAISCLTGVLDPNGDEIMLHIISRTAIWARTGPTEPVPET